VKTRSFSILGVLLALATLADGARAQTVEQFTHSGARNGQPAFSAEGSWILFVSDRESGWQVWFVAEDGDVPERISDEAGPVGRPVFSQDGQSILFYAERGDRYRLLQFDFATAETSVVDSGLRDAFRPDPSGPALLVDGVGEDGRGGHDLYLLRSGGAEAVAAHPGYDSDARWSPGGEWIAFHSDREAEEYQLQLWVVRPDGPGLRRVTEGPAVNAYPAWSPNGRCLVFTSERDNDRNLHVLSLPDGWSRRLTNHPGFDGDPVWDPRGGRILFATDRFGDTELAFLALNDDVQRRCEG